MAAFSPLLLVLLAEAGLRLAGVGYPSSFFIETTREGKRELIENRQFSWRFFPPRLARTPQPLVFAAAKPAGTIRVFLFGESAAMGDPEPSFGFARQLEVLLQARHPEKHVEVINTAMTAINSHVIREIAADCAAQAGDCWVVYSGNNEVIGPFGAGTVFGRQAPSVSFVRLALWLKKTRLGQCLGRLSKSPRLPARWEGMELFLNQQVPAGDARLTRVYENFRANLGAIVARGKSSGAKVLVATVPVNLRDSPPFGSVHRVGLSPDQLRDWETNFAAGKEAQQHGQFTDALKACERASRIDPDYAELVFRRALAEAAQGEASAAQRDFGRARELDTLRFRADAKVNETVRGVAREAQVELIDAEKELAAGSPDQIPGAELFYDHVHLNFHGNYLLARLFVPHLERQVFGRAETDPGAMLDEAAVARQLGFTTFDRRRVFQEMRLRLQQLPFSTQINFKQRDEQWRELLEKLSVDPANCLAEYTAAIAVRSSDWVLRANDARVLEAAGDASAAERQWREVCRLIPHAPESWFQLANLALNGRNYSEAERRFREVLRRDPLSTGALNGLGLTVSALGRQPEANKCFKSALNLDPLFADARINLAVLLGQSGDTNAAVSEYRTVLALETNNVAARINLARLFSGQGQPAEAIRLLQEAVALRPGEPFAQYDLGNALAAQHRYPEAISHYFAAIKARPDFAEARYNLALELARAGSIEEALAQFAEVVRLKPELADAHFNYGIALARQKRYPEAVSQFQQTLRLEPQHSSAQAALQRALALEKQRPAPAP